MDFSNPRRRPRPAHIRGAGLLLLAGGLTTLGLPPFAGAAPTTVVCSHWQDADETRAVLVVDLDTASVHSLEVVTPELLWSDPDRPETPRFPAGKTDVSPNLADNEQVAIRTTTDDDGALRIVDFAATAPMALEIEGFSGSLLLHQGFDSHDAYGSMFYSATGNLMSVTPVICRRY